MQISAAIRQIFLACVFLVVICPIAYAGSEQDATNSAEGVVKLLYRNYGWEAIGNLGKKGILATQDIQELRRYFEPSLANLILEDRECIKRTGDICRLDFSIIFGSQDPSAFDLKVSAMNERNEIRVRFKDVANQENELTFQMIKVADGWRIQNIGYKNLNTTLRDVLTDGGEVGRRN